MVMKIWRPIKAALWTIAGILILVFQHDFVHYLNYLVGTIMIVYGLETCALHLLHKKSFLHSHRFFWGALEILLGIVVLFLIRLGEPESKAYTIVCVIWAVWSMLRESHELEEAIIEIHHKEPAYLSMIESIIGIILSVLLIIEPGEHHAHTHVILLFVELVTTGFIFPYLTEFVHYIKRKKGIPLPGEEE